MRFSTITTKDLNGDIKTLPTDFTGDLNLVFVAYEQWHQREVDSWIPHVKRMEEKMSNFEHYELPVVGEMGMLGRMQLDFWMRTGIPDYDTRSRTLTLYVDREEFRAPLGIPNEEHIALLLIDGEGNVVWRDEGEFSEGTAVSLQNTMAIFES